MFLGKFAEAEEYARKGMDIYPLHPIIYSCLAPALLLQGKYAEAEEIYRTHKAELKEDFLENIKQLEEAGIIPNERRKDVENIKTLLNE